jgi:hypothetical protein
VPAGPGLAPSLAGDPTDVHAIVRAAAPTPGLPVVTAGDPLDEYEPQPWIDLAGVLAPIASTGPAVTMARVADRSLLVTRNRFPALRHATRSAMRTTRVVLVHEAHRALHRTLTGRPRRSASRAWSRGAGELASGGAGSYRTLTNRRDDCWVVSDRRRGGAWGAGMGYP